MKKTHRGRRTLAALVCAAAAAVAAVAAVAVAGPGAASEVVQLADFDTSP